MGKMDSLLLKSKFRGSLLGALMGDCLGSAYEGDELFSAGMKLVIQKSFDKLQGPHFKAPVIQFTDDSAMTRAVAESLIECTGFDQTHMAKKFVKSYYLEPNRGYGAGVTTVFHKLRNNKFVDVLGPAREQFNGEGSLGNGGAMRVAPITLFYYKNSELMVDTARKQSHITHTHKTGVDGAILQAIAIQQSLLLDPKEELDTCKFTDNLINEMDKIEIDEEGLGLVDPSPYKTQLKLLRNLICEDGDGPHDEKVVHQLGNDVSALHSVPTAIYCFLKAQKPIPAIQTENPLRRTVQYAISLGGDTDTIGSMAGAIAGAFYGEEMIRPEILKHCETSDKFRELADQLFHLATA
ncbi:ADP-ribosylhydrolase ARH3 [Neodiprion pinetum]|uniref:ADP-ribosylhydrolase ARH3 n=1 Tax=Neodiprion pinetum TaxID=441929 RepID=UPI001EDDB543|nr:ADP-ribose glycohydrolase ARH3-like [Neodiprion pinetum]